MIPYIGMRSTLRGPQASSKRADFGFEVATELEPSVSFLSLVAQPVVNLFPGPVSRNLP